MQQTPADLPCPPLAEAIDSILRQPPVGVEQMLNPRFAASVAAAEGQTPIRNGAPKFLRDSGEKPVHRLMCYMSLGGKTNKEIADETGYTPVAVSQILRSPEAKLFMDQEARRIAGGQVENMFKAQLAQTFQTLVEIRDSGDASPATRVAACNSILDRAFGKPTVYTKSESTITYDDAKSEMSEIDRQLEALRKQTRTETVPNGN